MNTYSWHNFDDPELLNVKICDLKLKHLGELLDHRINKFYTELDALGLSFKPKCYLSNQWLCPDQVPIIGVPFCFAHPRLLALEKTMMLEVEGETERDFLRLLRHEAGHAFNYAYKFYRRKKWKEIFGNFYKEYNVSEYYPRPYSKQFVEHLPDNYAQAHPDEDFAETFAVWLTPNSNWRKRYQGWPALKKLEFIDELMQEVGGKKPPLSTGKKLWPTNSLKSTLGAYYRKKRSEFGDSYPGYYDPELLKLFVIDEASVASAAQFLSHNRNFLIKHISKWGNVRKYAIDNILKKMIKRSSSLGLKLKEDEQHSLLMLATRLTSVLVEDRFRSQLFEED